jgi:glycosyltransferase involved in cell wall biosynthesis
MKILYIASAVVAPGRHGGATHVLEVAGELAKLGHELHVVCAYDKDDPRPSLALPVPGGKPIQFYRFRRADKLALLRYPWIARLAARLQPDLIMERYYNFAGAGMLYAHRHNLPSILEVNALMVDPPGSTKYRVDRFLLRRMEWWATKQGEWAGRIVTPLHTTVPPEISRDKIAELPWGANVEQFDPSRLSAEQVAKLRQTLGIPEGARVAAFVGSFRHWHGISDLVEAALSVVKLEPQIYFLLLGGGPKLEEAREKIAERNLQSRILTPGPVEHSQVPLYLALSDCGVAPFNTSRHLPLRHAGFFWSPLKIFEYMAMHLPVITTDLPPLNQIIRAGQEGLLFEEGNPEDLGLAIRSLLGATSEWVSQRQLMGRSARQRVVENYSWAAHCQSLDRLICQLTGQTDRQLKAVKI